MPGEELKLKLDFKLDLVHPVKNTIGIFSCLFDGSLVWFENEIKSGGNPIIFLVNAMEIP